MYFSHLLLNFYYKFLHDDGKANFSFHIFFILFYFSATADADAVLEVDGNAEAE